MELYINELWLLVTAVIFTAVGWYWGLKSQAINVVESTIDALINDGYLKTRGTGKDLVILKWREWDNTKSDETEV